ncbi:MAG: hypothetical protein M3462_09695 [Chloroflexota bacterium]|nr:hypothetical protein [Chloroflexota bacterium]
MPTCRSRLVLLVIVSLSVFGSLSTSAVARQATPVSGEVTILGPDEDYAGLSRGEWDARQWQWAVSMPPEINPVFEPTGAACGYGQSGPVFFIPGSFSPEPTTETRTCVVPEGMALFFGLGGAECSSVEPPPFFGRNEEELRACAVAATDEISEIGGTINGQEIPDPESYRTTSPLFTLNLPEGNFFGVPAGVALSVSDGYNVIIAPPPPGEYEFSAFTVFANDGARFEGTVRIIVEPAQIIEPEASPEPASPVASPGA